MSNQNVEVVKSFISAMDHQEWSALSEQLAPDFEMTFPGYPKLDKDSVVQFCIGWYDAFPDLAHDIQETIAEGSTVVVRVVVRGTHKRDFMGISATGRQVSVDSVGFAHVDDGRLAKFSVLPNLLGLMQQLGAIPSPSVA